MRRKAFRPENDISQQYNSGMVTVYTVTDAADPGLKPIQRPAYKVHLPYEEQRTGLTRYYMAKQADVEVERVLRIPRPPIAISPQDIAATEDGRQYRIEQVQTVQGIYPPSLDITLARIAQKYEVENVGHP